MDLLIRMRNLILLLILAGESLRDIKTETIMAAAAGIAAAAGAAANIISGEVDISGMGAGAMIGAGLLLISYAGKDAFGRGDAVMIMATGISLGFEKNMVLLIISLLSAALCSAVLIAGKFKERKDCIAFMPFVFGGYILVTALC